MTYDELAIDLLLAGHRPGSRALREASARADALEPCPECGSEGPHEDNGATGYALTRLCPDCGAQWNPYDDT